MMKSVNVYSSPLDHKDIRGIVTTESPAHKVYRDNETGAEFDLTDSIDFACD